MAILSCCGLVFLTGWAAQPSEDISWIYFQGQRNPLRTYYSAISDGYERVKFVESESTYFLKFFKDINHKSPRFLTVCLSCISASSFLNLLWLF